MYLYEGWTKNRKKELILILSISIEDNIKKNLLISLSFCTWSNETQEHVVAFMAPLSERWAYTNLKDCMIKQRRKKKQHEKVKQYTAISNSQN